MLLMCKYIFIYYIGHYGHIAKIGHTTQWKLEKYSQPEATDAGSKRIDEASPTIDWHMSYR